MSGVPVPERLAPRRAGFRPAGGAGRVPGSDGDVVPQPVQGGGEGAPDCLVEGWISTYTATAAGDIEHVSDGVQRLTGREPLTLREIELS